MQKDDDYWDQNAFNDLFRRGMDVISQRTDRLFRQGPQYAHLPLPAYQIRHSALQHSCHHFNGYQQAGGRYAM